MAEMSNNSHNNGHMSTTATGDVADDNDLVSYMNQKLTGTSVSPTKCCIYRVPDNLKSANENAYVPQIVSVGPFHHGKANLQAMQDQKWIYLKSFLSRSSIANNSPSSLDIAFVQSLRHLEQRARESYSETFDKLSSNAFLEMMILDGCFIIELFISHRMKSGGRELINDDPLFTTPRMNSYLVWDMILLENQLPLFVLEHLVLLNQLHHLNHISQEPSSFLRELAIDFFQHCLALPKTYFDHHQQHHLEISNHLLDLLRNCLLSPSRPSGHVTIDRVKDQQQVERSFIPCATDLNFAGIKIQRSIKDDNPFNVAFKYGVLEIPPLSIAADLSNPLLPNLVAFEQCHSDCSTSEFTSYAWLMLNIIKDADGVRFLHRRGIINQLPGCEKELVLLFKKMCLGVTLPRNFFFSELYDQLNEFFDRAITKWMHILRSQYFNSPWTVITIWNAAIILFLAAIQTIFTALPYITKRPS